MPLKRHELYEFRYRHELTGKWVKARYRATSDALRERYAEWETIGAVGRVRSIQTCAISTPLGNATSRVMARRYSQRR